MTEHLDRAVLVRVSDEILELLKDGKASPVVILGVKELDDGTYDMILQTPPSECCLQRDLGPCSNCNGRGHEGDGSLEADYPCRACMGLGRERAGR